eukprot:5337542-Alexandrium_andersonii.AAC.1
MSASLVGSEMCIRDRNAGELLTRHRVGHDGRTAFERLFGKPSRDDGYPVSYTHLTLPTICSV